MKDYKDILTELGYTFFCHNDIELELRKSQSVI